MLGREVSQPVDLILGTFEMNRMDKDVSDYLRDLLSAVSKSHEIARQNICISQIDKKDIMIVHCIKTHMKLET